MNKPDKLEREEKQPEGIKLSPLLSMAIEWNEKGGGRGLKEMMNNKQFINIFFGGIQIQIRDKALRV